MKISQISLFLVALVASSAVGMAQGPGGPGMGRMGGPRMKPGEREKKMLSELGLTPAQKKKTDAIIDDQVTKMMAMRPKDGTRPTPEAMKKFKALRDETRIKLNKVLTPAQAKKLEEMRKAQMMRFRGGPGGPPGTPKP